MPIAALYDIHANLPALEAVLAEIQQQQVDQIVVGGDVLPGPMPRETLDLLLKLEIPVQFIQGNGEVAVLESMAGREPSKVQPPYRHIIQWTAEQLSQDDRNTIAAWPKTLRLGDILFCHATPRNEDEIFTKLTSDAKLEPVFAGVDAALVVCGHTHMQFDRRVGKIRVVNAGSVGMPFGETGADWLLLKPEPELRHTNYGLADAAARIQGAAYPDDFADRYVLHPPSEQQMLAIYSKVELT